MQYLVQLIPYILITYLFFTTAALSVLYLDCIGHPSIYVSRDSMVPLLRTDWFS